MARNVEIKARVRDPERLRAAAAALATTDPVEIRQHDTFYASGEGRLKLRRFPDGSGELIHYFRDDDTGPRTSRYAIFRTSDAAGLGAVLAAALPVRGDVLKVRTLLMAGRTRIHLDEVAGLGSYLELEVVLAADEDEADGETEARRLLGQLGIDEADLVGRSYIDLLGAGPMLRGNGAAPS